MGENGCLYEVLGIREQERNLDGEVVVVRKTLSFRDGVEKKKVRDQGCDWIIHMNIALSQGNGRTCMKRKTVNQMPGSSRDQEEVKGDKRERVGRCRQFRMVEPEDRCFKGTYLEFCSR